MKLERPVKGDPSVKTKKALFPFGGPDMDLPAFDHPISIKENFYRAARRDNPAWAPIPLTDMQELHMTHIADEGPAGYHLGPSMAWTGERFTYKDAWENSWTWDPNAGGSCMTIGTRICDDILKWEEQIKFPDLHEWNLDDFAARYMKERYDPERVMHLDIFHGPFQTLADVLGGFAEALIAMFEEPEATRAFFDRYADWMIWLIDRLSGLYPVDMFTVHDDWGTERDAFFSPKMMEDLLFEPTKKIIDHVHGLGKLYQFHCCGKVDRFMPYMKELKPDFMQLQRNVNDFAQYKVLYGCDTGFQTRLEGLVPGKKYTDEEMIRMVRNTIDMMGEGGGWFPMLYSRPNDLWATVCEIYCYSREKYAK